VVVSVAPSQTHSEIRSCTSRRHATRRAFARPLRCS
jgi:hypothetical protein